VANVVNTVRVVNSKKNKSSFDSGVITNSTSVNKFGKQTPKGGVQVKKGYVDSDKEAKRVAENIIRDSQNPTEGGRVKVAGRFTNNVSNSSFTLNDPVRDLNGKDATPEDVFVCWSQVNFYPENKSILEFQFENQDEREADITDDVRAERATTFGSSSTDVGSQKVSATTEEVSNRYDDFGGDNHGHGNSDSTSDLNSTQFSQSVQATAFSQSLKPGESDNIDATVNYDGNAYQIEYFLDTDAGFGAPFIVQISIDNDIRESKTVETNNGGDIRGQISGLDDISGDSVEFLYVNKSGSNVDVGPTLTLRGEEQHDHPVPVSDTNDANTGGDNDVNTNDPSAGDTSQLGASGSTDSKDVNITEENSTDRG